MDYDRIQAGLDAFNRDDESSRRDGAAILFSEGIGIAEPLARRKGCTPEEAQDVAVDSVLHLLHHPALKFTQAGAWIKYLGKTVDSKTKDAIRRRGTIVEYGEDYQDPRTQQDEKDSEVRDQALQILKAADDHWLGSEPPDFEERLLAAQLLCVDGLPWETVVDMVAHTLPRYVPKSEADLRQWLADVRVVRSAAYLEVYHTAPKLTARIVGCDEDDLAALFERIQTCVPTDHAHGGWTWQELSVIEHKFYRYQPTLRVHEHCIGCLQKEQVCEIVGRCALRLPFAKVMKDVWNGFETNPTRQKAFGEARFWKRLAFQCIIADGLRRHDFEDWLCPCAEGTGFAFSAETLQGWIANKRLVKELREYLHVVYGVSGNA